MSPFERPFVHRIMRWVWQAFVCRVVLELLDYGFIAWKIFQFGNQPDNVSADAAVARGVAAWGNKPSPIYRECINEALLLYRQGRVKWIIFTDGSRTAGFPSEAEMGRQFSAQHQAPLDAMLVETESHTTWQNLVNARELMRLAGC